MFWRRNYEAFKRNIIWHFWNFKLLERYDFNIALSYVLKLLSKLQSNPFFLYIYAFIFNRNHLAYIEVPIEVIHKMFFIYMKYAKVK